MTIDEMIKELEDQASYHDVCLSDPRAIIAALKAGQAMRNCFEAIKCDYDSTWAVAIERVNLGDAGLAWDAATKGVE